MKNIFAIATALLAILSIVAWRLQPPASRPGTQPVVWSSDDNPLRKGQISLFNQTNPGFDLQLDPGNGALEKIIVQSLAGVGPDIFDCGDGFQLSAYVKSGVSLDLTDILAQSGIKVEQDTFVGAHGPAILDGRVYGLPTNVAGDGIWFHKDLFDAEGVPYPKGPMNWQQFVALAQRLTKKDAAGKVVRYGFLFEWYTWQHFLRGFGGKVYSPDGTRCVINHPESVAAIQLMQDLVYKYKVSPSPADEAAMATQGGWGSGSTTYFGAERGAMALGGRWWLATLRGYKGLHLGVTESPYQKVREFRGYGRATMVNKNSKNLKGAIAFLKYLASPQYNNLVNDQADGVCAFTKYASGPQFEHNPQHPEEDSNLVWLEIAQHSVPDSTSPYIDGAVANRLIQLQLDLVKAGQKKPPAAMRDAALAINKEIAANLKEDPTLAARYAKATGARP